MGGGGWKYISCKAEEELLEKPWYFIQDLLNGEALELVFACLF